LLFKRSYARHATCFAAFQWCDFINIVYLQNGETYLSIIPQCGSGTAWRPAGKCSQANSQSQRGKALFHKPILIQQFKKRWNREKLLLVIRGRQAVTGRKMEEIQCRAL
jgi:hypothetical protein